MGYLLPIQPIQSQQYANRMNMEPYSFTYIDRVGKIQREPDFADEFYRTFQYEQLKDDVEVKPVAVTPPPYKGFIYPNPANLSPAIALVVGKGISINTYV